MEFSLCANGGSSCLRQEEGNLVGLCQILNPFLLTPFSDCAVAKLLAGGRKGGVRSDSSLSVLHMNRCDHTITIVWIIALCIHSAEPVPGLIPPQGAISDSPQFSRRKRGMMRMARTVWDPSILLCYQLLTESLNKSPQILNKCHCKWCKLLVLMRNDDAMFLLLLLLLLMRIVMWQCLNINYLKVINMFFHGIFFPHLCCSLTSLH